MRINISWTSPQIHGKPLKTWAFHYWKLDDKLVRSIGLEGQDMGVRFLGLDFQLSTAALWSGLSLSINVLEHPKPEPKPVERKRYTPRHYTIT